MSKYNQNYQYLFTVFTPTYNRAHTLHRVYQSLEVQTYRDFEWLIIDDGSTDNTHEIVKAWQKESKFVIRYILQDNSGKHVAFNRGVKEAKGKLFLTFDSDDACLPNALERFKYYWDSIPNNLKNHFSAVTALCVNQHGNLVGDLFPFDITDSNSIEIKTKHNVYGEKWGFQKTDILKEFPFPELAGEKFITEAIVWNRIAKKYKTRYVNEKLRIYHEESSDSLTKFSVKTRVQNPQGSRLYYEEYLSASLPIKDKIKLLLNYIRFSFHSGQNPLDNRKYQLLKVILLPFGYLISIFDKTIIKY
jgi:glycosyltransferase involved in cell wall biosynthesis